MSLSVNGDADVAEEFSTVNSTSNNIFHHLPNFANEDVENVSEYDHCLQYVDSNSQSPINNKFLNADSDLKKSEVHSNGFTDNIRQYLANKNLNTAVGSKVKDNSKDVPFIKRVKRKPDSFSVKYSVSESKPLIAEDDCKIYIEYEKAPTVMQCLLQKEKCSQRPTSCDYILENVLNEERTRKSFTSAQLNQTASSPPLTGNNSDSFAASCNGSLVNHHLHQLNNTLKYESQVQIHQKSNNNLQSKSALVTDSQQDVNSPDVHSLNPNCGCPKSTEYCNNISLTNSLDNICLNQTCLCKLSVVEYKDNTSTDLIKEAIPTQSFCTYPSSNEDTALIYKHGNNQCISDSAYNTLPPTNSSATEDASYIEPILNNFANTTISMNDDKPFLVFLPQRKKTDDMSQGNCTMHNGSQTAIRHFNHNFDSCCYQGHQHHTMSSCNHPVKMSSTGHDDTNTSILHEISTHANNIDISNVNKHKGVNNATHVYTFPTEEICTLNSSVQPFYSHTNNHVSNGSDDPSLRDTQLMCKHTDDTDYIPACRRDPHTHIYAAVNTDQNAFSTDDLPTSYTNQERDCNTQFAKLTTGEISNLLHIKSNQENINSNLDKSDMNNFHFIPGGQNKFQDSSPLFLHENIVLNHSRKAATETPNNLPRECHALHFINLKASENTGFGYRSCNNTDNLTGECMPSTKYDHQNHLRQEVMENCHNVMNHRQARNDDFRSETIHDVRSSNVDVNFNGSQENLVSFKRSSNQSSIPYSVDIGHLHNQEGSFHRLSTTEVGGYGKATSVLPVNTNCTDRLTPDYSYLCVVATVLNPVFGIIALICNYFARKHFQLHKLAKANNFYFATITISTVAIFLTLVAATLLITHSLVTPTEKRLSLHPPPSNSCESNYFCSEETIKSFFDIDITLYCEITKHDKIMSALKHYWLKEIQNMEKFKKPITSTADNTTNANDMNNFNGTEKALNDPFFNSYNKNDTNQAGDVVKDGETGKDGSNGLSNMVIAGTSAPRPPTELIKDNKHSHNTILNSNNGPVVPPELEREYQLYLQENREMKMENV